MSKIEELKERVLKYRMLQLPGQPMAAHMGTSYLIGDLLAAVEEYATELDKYVDELADVDARADRLQAENERLRSGLRGIIDMLGRLAQKPYIVKWAINHAQDAMKKGE